MLVSAAYAFAGWHDYNQQGMKQHGGAIGATSDEADADVRGLCQLDAGRRAEWPKTHRPDRQPHRQRVSTGRPRCPRCSAPTLLVYGDWDAVRTAHAATFFELLGGGKQDANWDGSGMNHNRLAILPGATHYTIFVDPRLAATAAGFLDAEAGTDEREYCQRPGRAKTTSRSNAVLRRPRALVYKCYTEPQHLARFWGPRDAKTVSTIDLRVGGVWRTDWHYENGGDYGYSSASISNSSSPSASTIATPPMTGRADSTACRRPKCSRPSRSAKPRAKRQSWR